MMDANLLNQAATLLGPSAQSVQRSAQAAVSNPSAIDTAAQEFEAVMLTTMLKPIFEGIETPEPFGGGQGEQMWQGMLVEEYANEIAASGGIGIADEVRRELMLAQELANAR